MSIRDELSGIASEFLREVAEAADVQTLEQLKGKLLGKKSRLTALLRSLGQVAAEERPQMGQLINEQRQKLESMLEDKRRELAAKEKEYRLRREALDVTEPRDIPEIGQVHPMQLVLREVLDCFTGLGFQVVEGPEVELDKYNFEYLNLPKNHPARDAQDTFYIEDNIVMRTHTSPVQARVMLSQRPPIRVVCPGRVFRADEIDATHSPVFHQI